MKKVNIGDAFGCMVVKSVDQQSCVVECECGLSKKVLKSNLLSGRTRSLGCLRSKNQVIELKPITINHKLLDRYNMACLSLGLPQVTKLPPENPDEIPHWVLTQMFFLKPAQFRMIFSKGASLTKTYKGYLPLIKSFLDNQPSSTEEPLLDELYHLRSLIIKKLLF